MGIHCKKCKEYLMNPIDEQWEAWTRLKNYLDIQKLSGTMTKKLYNQLVDDLMYLQPIDEIEDVEENEQESL